MFAAGGGCNQGTNGGVAPGGQAPATPGAVKVCDTNITYGPRLNTTNYQFAAVEVRANTICDKEPKSHQLGITLKFRAKPTDKWSPFIPGNNGAIGGYCFSGTSAPGGKPPGNCDMAVQCQTGEWSVGIDARGTGPAPAYIPFQWNLPDNEAPVVAITCPKVPVPRK